MLASGILYKSVNGGKTFDKVDVTSSVYFSQIVRTADERIVRSITLSKCRAYRPRQVYLPSSTDIWVSLDKGNSFVQRPYDHSQFTIWADYCEPHPTKGEWLACLSLNPAFPTKSKSRWQAVVTQDMGATWTVVANYALDLGWAYECVPFLLVLALDCAPLRKTFPRFSHLLQPRSPHSYRCRCSIHLEGRLSFE